MRDIHSLVTTEPAAKSESIDINVQRNEDDDEVLLATLRQEVQREKEELAVKTTLPRYVYEVLFVSLMRFTVANRNSLICHLNQKMLMNYKWFELTLYILLN